MAKKDITVQVRGHDEFLKQDLPPRHRRIIENYRRHALLEVMGEWEQIFTPEMTVEHPCYYFNISYMLGVVLDGAEAVQAVYAKLAENETSVMLVERERLAVADWGFASDSIFNTYFRGWDAADKDLAVDNLEGFYILQQHLAMIWPYDEDCRLIGEHVYENLRVQEVIEISEEEYITLEETKAALSPYLRSLPALLG
jgi:hypothetical protein